MTPNSKCQLGDVHGNREKLAKAVEKKRTRLGVPRLGVLTLTDPSEIRERKADAEAGAAEIEQSLANAADVLADYDRASRQASEVTEVEEQIRGFIAAVQFLREREELTVACMRAMVEHYPPSGDALNRIATMGLSLGFFQEVEEGSRVPERQVVHLPVSRENGRGWRRSRLTSNFPGGKGIVPALRQKAEEASESQRKARWDVIERLREGAGRSLSEALSEGKGEVFFFLPDERTETGRFLPGGNIRVKVEDGLIIPIASEGKISARFRECVEEGTTLPVAQLGGERLNLNRFVEEEEFKRILFLHGLCRRRLAYEQRVAELRARNAELRGKARYSWAEWLADDDLGGSTYLHIHQWRVGRGRDAEVHRDIGILVERRNGEVRVVETTHEDLLAECRAFALPGAQAYPLKQILSLLERKALRNGAPDESGGEREEE